MITLQPLMHRERLCIAMHGVYSPGILPIIKQQPDVSYTRTHQCWYILYSEKNLHTIRAVLEHISPVKVIDNQEQSLPASLFDAVSEPILIVLPKEYEETLRKLRYSESTLNNYVIQFRKFLEYIYPATAEDIVPEQIHNYLLHLVDHKKVSVSTQNTAINALKFYLEQVRKDQRQVYYIDRPRKPTQLPTVLSQEELAALISKIKNLKHRTLICLIYATGLRISEVLALKPADIDVHRMMVIVRGGKGNKDRITVLSQVALAMLKSYLPTYNPRVYLFEGPEGKEYSARSVNAIIKRASDAAGILKNVSAHTLRHSFATHLLERGTDLRYIQTLLGHENSKTTERYAHVTKKGFEQLMSPLDYLFSQNVLAESNKDI